MIFAKSIIDIIKERTSWRTYEPKPLEEGLRARLIKLLELEGVKSPFDYLAGKYRFGLIGMPEFDPNEKKKIGTYGVIQGAQDFIVGAIEKSEYDRETYGYLMEYIILGATDLGLGTCWLGGFFNRTLFGSKFNTSENEIIPAITSTGYYPKKRRKMEVVVRKSIRADKRYPWERLFFDGDFSKPLVQEAADKHATLIEMVRLAPSAGNKQPWRIVKDSEEDTFHFYTIEVSGKYSVFPPIDIGIAVCHWDLTAKELGIKGKWEISRPNIPSEGYIYKISWHGQQ